MAAPKKSWNNNDYMDGDDIDPNDPDKEIDPGLDEGLGDDGSEFGGDSDDDDAKGDMMMK